MDKVGIIAYGGYIPRLRLSRESIVNVNSWVDPGLAAHKAGERSMCDVDEDSITMAVEASRDSLINGKPQMVDALYFASTTMPFADRQNSTIIAEALGLKEEITTLDVSHSQRAGSSGLITALKAAGNSEGGTSLYVTADNRQTKCASVQELLYGAGAAALIIGKKNLIAEFLGSRSINRDMADHFRGTGERFDYQWEERWVREEGYFKIVPAVIKGLLDKTGVSASDIDHFVMPCIIRRVRETIAKKIGIVATAVRDNLQAGCGETGTAHSITMLVDALQDAGPGEKILVVGFGQGADALLFETTDKLAKLALRKGIKGSLADGIIEKNYQKFQSFNNLVEIQWGIRAESSARIRPSAAYRNRKMLNSLVGGQCTKCKTVQFPAAHICVNPNCRALDSMEDYPLAGSKATVASYTVDWLAFSPNPPLMFGMVEFEEGAKFMMQFVGCKPDDIEVGMPLEMVFRVKAIDNVSGFRTYFWKAAPQSITEKEG
ncbi:MAG: hydroxymethylglutaryl-CoA synthase family protein [Deltaproteobacteria bacterium]|nr:hydroxymethylglutaryl-CoA synthase family protein [Deltaproteobacteria bacterium]